MKKLMLSLCIIAGVLLSHSAEAQKSNKKQKFYYYPEANVYYDQTNNQYAYDNNGSWAWSPALPPTVKVSKNDKKVMVYHDNPDVWSDNKVHVMKYKNGEFKKEKTKPAKDKTTSSNGNQQ